LQITNLIKKITQNERSTYWKFIASMTVKRLTIKFNYFELFSVDIHVNIWKIQNTINFKIFDLNWMWKLKSVKLIEYYTLSIWKSVIYWFDNFWHLIWHWLLFCFCFLFLFFYYFFPKYKHLEIFQLLFRKFPSGNQINKQVNKKQSKTLL
jgi:hypothetical protein